MKAKVFTPVLILVVAVIGAVVMLANRRQLQPASPQAAPIAVRVIEVTPGPVQLKVHAQGTVSPRTETQLVPEVSGNVTWISADLVAGGYFERDEELLRIDERDYRAAVQRAQATLSRAQADYELARFELERSSGLFEQDLISRSDYENNIRTARVAEAALSDARLVLQTAQLDLARTSLKAPFAGFVRTEQVDVGQFINRGSSIAEVYASDLLEVRLPIADQQLAYLNVPIEQRGELPEEFAPDVTLTAQFAGQMQTWSGKLARTEAQIDPGSRMVYAIARVRADDQANTIAPPVGLFVQAEIEGIAEDNVVVLPRSAIRNENQVLIVDTENRMYFREVDVLRVYRDDAYIRGGLAAGELVIVSPLQTVVNGMRVQPLTPES